MITEERKNELQTDIMQILEKDCNFEEIKEILQEMLDYANNCDSLKIFVLRKN